MKRLLLSVLLSLASLPAFAQFMTGAQLKDYLDEAQAHSSFMKETFAMGYVSGVFDSLAGREVCPEHEVSAKDSMGIVHRYLRAHPEQLSQNAAPLAAQALRDAYPCNR